MINAVYVHKKRDCPVKSVALLTVVAIILSLFAVTACGLRETSETTAPIKEPITIRLMTSWTSGTVAYNQAVKFLGDYMAANPHVTITHDALPSAELRTRMTVEMATGNPHDISWCVLSYAREFIKDSKIIDWAPVFDDPRHPEFRQWFDEKSLLFAKSSDGKIMLAPQEGSVDGLFYDAKLFSNFGWKPPTTFDELIDVIGKAKAVGMEGIALGGRDVRFAWIASALLVRTGGLDKANELCLGRDATRYSDPSYGFISAMSKFQELVAVGAFSSEVLNMSAKEADAMFANNEAAFYYEGAWKPANFEANSTNKFVERLERVDFPAMTDMPGDADINVGGNIIGFFIANGLSEVKTQTCIEVVKMLVSPEFNVPIMEKGGFVYAGNAPYDVTKVSKVMNQLIQTYRTTSGFIPSMDAFAPPSVDLALKQTVMPGIVSGMYTVEQAVAEIQRVAQEYLDAGKR